MSEREELTRQIKSAGMMAYIAGEIDISVTLGILANAIVAGREAEIANACTNVAIRRWADLGEPIKQDTPDAA